MGSFYTNITLRTTDVDRVAAALRQARRAALIAPPDRDCTVVYDEASEEQDVEVLRDLATHLSRACACPALAVLNHDDDVLVYLLCDGGNVVDEYDSAPGYFEEDGETEAPPRGGDAERLSRTFGAVGRAREVERILRTPGGTHDEFVFATDRHREVVEALGLPGCAVGTGFTYLEEGEPPDGLAMSALRRV